MSCFRNRYMFVVSIIEPEGIRNPRPAIFDYGDSSALVCAFFWYSSFVGMSHNCCCCLSKSQILNGFRVLFSNMEKIGFVSGCPMVTMPYFWSDLILIGSSA